MVETARYSLIQLEDLQLGTGTRSVRLADGANHTLHDVHVAGLLLKSIFQLRATDFAGTAVMTGTARLLAGARVWGVTIKIVVTFSTASALSGLLIGDSGNSNRWSANPVALTAGTVTSQADFQDPSLMVYNVPTDLLIGAVGGLFTGAGIVECCVHYSLLVHPS